jgi:hypothetical protein
MLEWMKAAGRQQILGWQYDMIYLGGDPCNPEPAAVSVRALNRAIVVRAADGDEAAFQSLLIPYVSVEDCVLLDEDSGLRVPAGGKGRLGARYSRVLLCYREGGEHRTMDLRMSASPDPRQNAKLCKNMQEFVTQKRNRSERNENNR